MSKHYKAAIVGCGSIGQAHMQGYQRLDNVDVVAVADPLEPARKMYMNDYGIPQGYSTVAEMLEKARPEIVSVCVWHLLNDTVTADVAASPSVKGIICEKPMAIGMGRADAMVDVCEANGVKLAISHQRRFTPGWEKARELVEDGVIGIPLRADIRVKEGLANWGTHSIDGARFILGDPVAEWVMGAVERTTDKRAGNDWWSLRPVVRPAVPQLKSDWVSNPVDAFVLQRLRRQGLSPSPPASPLPPSAPIPAVRSANRRPSPASSD